MMTVRTSIQVNSEPIEHEAMELMTRHGITRVQVVQYRYKNWRYSNLRDAVAQADRDASAQSGRAD